MTYPAQLIASKKDDNSRNYRNYTRYYYDLTQMRHLLIYQIIKIKEIIICIAKDVMKVLDAIHVTV